MDARNVRNPADAFKYYNDLIQQEITKLEESLAAIADYSQKMHAVAQDTTRRLIGRS